MLQDKVKETKKTEILLNTGIQEIKGKEMVEEVVLSNNSVIKASGVFVEIGWSPKSDFLKDLVRKNERGEIIVDEEGKTSLEGLFGAGDCCNSKYKQIVLASASGAIAALSAFEYLSQK